ncbi:hypothetical protein B9Z44_06915 [Limnohabitans curvus]|uniref:DUF3304 domain-containing protein n=1 Tax=Limnohabitans curvus TaxID=323423 RepID=A0A315ETM9_9BURK|nr:hypothetical protein B9Z44_06915 [Limnohabitans curvus]
MNFFYRWLRVLALAVLPLLIACASTAGEDTVGTSVSGVGHYGKRIGVADFFVNGQWAGAVTGWGGGGKSLCCVSLPRHPDKPVMVTVKWRTIRSNVGEEAWHEQTVPVNFAAPSGDGSGLKIHFLPGHQVQAWYTSGGAWGDAYPGPAYPKGPAPDYAPRPNEKPQPNAEVKP